MRVTTSRVLSEATVALLVLSVLTLGLGIRPARSSPVTITVPDDFPTIQLAVNAANQGDTVYVRAGTYFENVVLNKSLSLVGENPKTTIIDGSNGGTVVGIDLVPGIAVDIDAPDVNLTGFTVRNTEDWGVGITMVGESYCNVYGNNITASSAYSEGIEVIKSSSNNRVFENSITAGGGICIEWSCNNNYVAENDIVRCGVGVTLAYALYNSIASNDITNCGVGVAIGSYSYYNNVFGNNITNCKGALEIGSDASNNSIVGNNVVNNGVGVKVWADTPNNMFYDNSFIDNMQHVSNNWSSMLTWDNGTNGNYWSDYMARYPNASRIDGSAVWDMAYTIDMNNIDHHPLVNQATTVIPLYIVTISVGDGGSVVYSYNGGSGSVPSGQKISLNLTLGTQVSLTAYPSMSFVFQGWNIDGLVSISNTTSLSITATVNGEGLVTVSFVSAHTISFVESGLPEGNGWSMTLDDVTQYSTTNTIIFSELKGEYNYTVDNIFSYTCSPRQGSIVVNGSDVNQFVNFTRISTYTHPLNSFVAEPSETDFNTGNATVGTEFNVTVYACIGNSTSGWQVKMTFNPAEVQEVAAGYTGTTANNFTGMTGSQFFAGYSTISVVPHVDNVWGSIMMCESILGDTARANDASLMWVEFRVVSVPNATHPSLNGTFGINNTDTYFLDTNVNTIPTTKYDGAYSFNVGVHDVAVTNITANPAWVYQGMPANVTVTVKDNGDFPENVSVTLYYNITAYKMAGTQDITLLSGQNETLLFIWNTADAPHRCDNYTLMATAAIPEDNTLSDGSTTVASAREEFLVKTIETDPAQNGLTYIIASMAIIIALLVTTMMLRRRKPRSTHPNVREPHKTRDPPSQDKRQDPPS